MTHSPSPVPRNQDHVHDHGRHAHAPVHNHQPAHLPLSLFAMSAGIRLAGVVLVLSVMWVGVAMVILT